MTLGDAHPRVYQIQSTWIQRIERIAHRTVRPLRRHGLCGGGFGGRASESLSLGIESCDIGSAAAGPRQVKHSFLMQFLHEEEAEASKAQSGAARQLLGLRARVLDAVFGIAAPDPKLGKEGSRVIHPQSAFATGARAAPAAGCRGE